MDIYSVILGTFAMLIGCGLLLLVSMGLLIGLFNLFGITKRR